jgi:5'-phosphate synthase pdxT subunit
MRVGVLALQGGYDAHLRALAEVIAARADAGAHAAVPVRTAAEIAACDGLVLPGGESTTHLKLIERFDLAPALSAHVAANKPLLATCAGLILAARTVSHPAQASFGWLDVAVSRNAWGAQVHSFESVADGSDLPLLFIRAPRITEVGPAAEVLHTWQGEPIHVRQGAVHGMAFHPELTGDRRVHRGVFFGDWLPG